MDTQWSLDACSDCIQFRVSASWLPQSCSIDCNMGGKRRSILRAVELWEIPIQAYSVTSCGVNIVSYLKVRVASLCIVG